MTAAELLALSGEALGDLGGWWPARTPFEVSVGAVLVQAVAWRNAQLAIDALARRDLLQADALSRATREEVAAAVRPALFHRQKAGYLQALARFVHEELQGDILSLKAQPPSEQRRRLLALRGIGPETAAAIMVYALGEAVPVVDRYAIRLLTRIGAINPEDGAQAAQAAMSAAIAGDPARARLLHATIVEIARGPCRPEPRCASCPIAASCPKVLGHPAQGRGDRPGRNAGRAAAPSEAGDSGGGRAAPPQGGGRAGARIVGQGAGEGLGQSQRPRQRQGRRHRGA